MGATCSCLLRFLQLIALMLIHATLILKIHITQFLSIQPFPTLPSSDATHHLKFVRYKFVQLFRISSVLACPTC